MTVALFPGSFDPVTNGHVDLIRRASALFDEVVVGVGINLGKSGRFAPAERQSLIETVVAEQGLSNVRVVLIEGLTYEAAKTVGATTLIRGLRSVTDFDYERPIAEFNHELADLETVFLVADPQHQKLSSSQIKELVRFGGDVTPYVPHVVAEALQN